MEDVKFTGLSILDGESLVAVVKYSGWPSSGDRSQGVCSADAGECTGLPVAVWKLPDVFAGTSEGVYLLEVLTDSACN